MMLRNHKKKQKISIQRHFLKYALYFTLIFLIGFLLYILIFKDMVIDKYEKFFDPKIKELQNKLSPVFPEIKNLQISGSNKSFTQNKSAVYICAKDEKGNYYDDNMLIYVMLHELAHVLCDEIGHTPKYTEIFQSLLDRATEAGLYDPSVPPIDNYCEY